MKKVILTPEGLKELEKHLESDLSKFKEIRAKLLKDNNSHIYCEAVISVNHKLTCAIPFNPYYFQII